MASPPSQPDRIALIVGAAVVIALLLWLASWTGRDQSSVAIDVVWTLLTSGPLALLWIASAFGIGWPLRQLLAKHASERLAVQVALGISMLLLLDAAFGAMGWLQIGGSLGAWSLLAVGLLLLLTQISLWAKTSPAIDHPAWMIWTAAPAIAVLLVAACSAPGWLWATEFGGYDALSYHLQLPKEWLAAGFVKPVDHNVYSFLPGYVEAAYYHLAVLKGDGIASVYSAQMLHAMIVLLTAYVVHRLASNRFAPDAGPIASVLVLGTPWLIVVGSLAFNEMPNLLLLAAGLIVVLDDRIDAIPKGVAIGVLAGAACGAKLTAIGLVAMPLGLALVASLPLHHWMRAILTATACGAIMLLPYIVRNQMNGGNPVFPFATGLLGTAHWTHEQAAHWHGGHVVDATVGERFKELWNQFLRFGIGRNPSPHEPWLPQWSILPWLAMFGLMLGLLTKSCRRITLIMALVLLAQIIFWLSMTHLKSRFLLPAVVPMALLASAGISIVINSLKRSPAKVVAPALLATLLVAWATVPMFIFSKERHSAPAALIAKAHYLTGDDFSAPQQREAALTVSPSIAVNHLLDPDSKTLLIGHATPLYFRLDRIAYQTTWDRGPLSRVMRTHPDDPAQWAKSMRESGFTHLLVDEPMLTRWQQSGWNDPLLTAERVRMLTTQHATLIAAYPNGITLYQLITESTH